MGDFRDGLLKAGLVSAEQAKEAEEQKAAAEARAKAPPQHRGPPRPPREGGGGGGGGGGQHPQQHRQRPAPRSDEPRDRTPATLSKEESVRLFKLAQAGKVEGRTRGQKRFYYVARAGTVPYLELSDEAFKDVELGRIAIAESERGEAWLVNGDCATELEAVDPAWIRTP